MTVISGAPTAWALFSHEWIIALLCLVVHGNIYVMMVSGLHELIHGTMFQTKWLNTALTYFVGFCGYTEPRPYVKMHTTHHIDALHETDLEIPIACRPIWAGSYLWNSTFNLPRFVFSAINTPRFFVLHLWLACAFIWLGWWPLIIVFTLGPFWFGWLEFLLVATQHYGLPMNSNINDCTRSIKLPRWISFLHWHMEYHAEHHHYPSVPCYWLKKLHEDRSEEFPKQQTLLEAWRTIVRKPKAGDCGHGSNPLAKLLQRQ